MKKRQMQGITVLVILCVLFCLIAFLPPFAMKGTFWAAFVAGILAPVFQVYFFRRAFTGEGDVRSRFYGFPLVRIGMVYFIVQWILSILEMAFAAVLPAWAAILADGIVLAAALLGGIAAETVREEVQRQDTVLKKDVSAMRELQSLSDAVVNQCKDETVKRELRRMADQIRYSDPVSSEATAALETAMLGQLREIQRTVVDGDTGSVKKMTEKLLVSLTERNRICRMSK